MVSVTHRHFTVTRHAYVSEKDKLIVQENHGAPRLALIRPHIGPFGCYSGPSLGQVSVSVSGDDLLVCRLPSY